MGIAGAIEEILLFPVEKVYPATRWKGVAPLDTKMLKRPEFYDYLKSDKEMRNFIVNNHIKQSAYFYKRASHPGDEIEKKDMLRFLNKIKLICPKPEWEKYNNYYERMFVKQAPQQYKDYTDEEKMEYFKKQAFKYYKMSSSKNYTPGQCFDFERKGESYSARYDRLAKQYGKPEFRDIYQGKVKG